MLLSSQQALVYGCLGLALFAVHIASCLFRAMSAPEVKGDLAGGLAVVGVIVLIFAFIVVFIAYKSVY